MAIFNTKAPEIVSKPENWINSPPLSLAGLAGNIVLLDFFAYSCVNCIRTLPALAEMWKKYKNRGAVIIGIHTHEFQFEKELENVKAAVKKLGIEYPVLSDPKRINWINYGNMYWPRAALIDRNGYKIMDHVGEAGYDKIDAKIAQQLQEAGQSLETEILTEKRKFYAPEISKETYAGSLRNRGIGSKKVCSKTSCDEYLDARDHERDVIYVQGLWKQQKEYIEFVGESSETPYFAFTFYASELNIVMDGKGRAEILINEMPLEKTDAGKHVKFENGKSYVHVDMPNMYNLYNSDQYSLAEIKIIPFKNLKIFALTFG